MMPQGFREELFVPPKYRNPFQISPQMHGHRKGFTPTHQDLACRIPALPQQVCMDNFGWDEGRVGGG